jgi:hypothetical protein
MKSVLPQKYQIKHYRLYSAALSQRKLTFYNVSQTDSYWVMTIDLFLVKLAMQGNYCRY